MSFSNSKQLAVLLPGFGCDEDSMLELGNGLDNTKSVSHTKYEVFSSEPSLDKMAGKVVKQYPDSELLLIGFSMGGWVAQEVASRLGSQLKGLVLISSWTEAPSQYLEIVQSLYEEIRSGKKLDSLKPLVAEGFVNAETRNAMVNRWVSMANRVGPETFLRQTKAILENPSVSKNISNIQCPMLAIAGAEDTLIKPTEQFKHLQDKTKCETKILASCGHNLIWERPITVFETVKQWIHLNLG